MCEGLACYQNSISVFKLNFCRNVRPHELFLEIVITQDFGDDLKITKKDSRTMQ